MRGATASRRRGREGAFRRRRREPERPARHPARAVTACAATAWRPT